jgi:hypothetical protein
MKLEIQVGPMHDLTEITISDPYTQVAVANIIVRPHEAAKVAGELLTYILQSMLPSA